MCIAILMPSFKTVDKDTLKRCNTTNPDGFGYAYFDDNGKLIIKKEVDGAKIPAAINKFLDIRLKNIEKPFIAHFRIATHGRISTRCTHPFRINKSAVFCHNGILNNSFGATRDGDMSDTMMFNRVILQQLNFNSLDKMISGKNPVLKELLEGYIGDRNKMILLNRAGDFQILNEKKGVWDKGVWYSNTTYKEIKITSFWQGGYWDNKQGCFVTYEDNNWYNGHSY